MNSDVYNKYETEVCLYNLVFYTTERGDSPVDDFLDGLDKKSRAKVAAHLSILEEQGPHLKRPYADVVRGKIRELRIHQSSNQYRILYFFQLRDQIILAHAFSKKTQQLKERDIELAERRMQDWIKRHPAGGKI
ncbi:type II toxin-antitoxin system RelE/ParE family toxin [candidate division WS5 bacterium]|uniref:Type II toxin-antitoxin system RelE/ParE family toxin n=1 Tax=candidate division WS5 bacterium TaxID=2093353 RepID=A0A419DFF8_9BACT|nr:MAG: type II toxin-antitoxin system RelE/ParE family toxin [candidate division WS5 bacterium]